MTEEKIALQSLVEKASDIDLLREMMGCATQWMQRNASWRWKWGR